MPDPSRRYPIRGQRISTTLPTDLAVSVRAYARWSSRPIRAIFADALQAFMALEGLTASLPYVERAMAGLHERSTTTRELWTEMAEHSDTIFSVASSAAERAEAVDPARLAAGMSQLAELARVLGAAMRAQGAKAEREPEVWRDFAGAMAELRSVAGHGEGSATVWRSLASTLASWAHRLEVIATEAGDTLATLKVEGAEEAHAGRALERRREMAASLAVDLRRLAAVTRVVQEVEGDHASSAALEDELRDALRGILDEPLSIELPEDVAHEVEKAAAEAGCTPTEIVAAAMRRWAEASGT